MDLTIRVLADLVAAAMLDHSALATSQVQVRSVRPTLGRSRLRLSSLILGVLLTTVTIVPGFAGAPTLRVTTGLQLWLAGDAIDPNDPNQVTNSNGTLLLRSWRDRSPNAAHATQANAARQPNFVPGVVYGQGVVRFDGVNDFLATTRAQIAGDKSIFIVHKRVFLTQPSGTEISSTSAGNGHFFGNNAGAETFGRLGIAHDASLPCMTNEYVLKSTVRSGQTTTFWVNDATVTTTAADRAGGNYTISDPTSFPYCGAIAEVLVYNRAVTESERQSIEDYLSEKWGLWALAVPVRSGLELWLSTDGINMHDPNQVQTRSGARFVTRWQGRSLLGRGAAQTNTARQPTLVLNGLNNRPVVRFDGVNDVLTTALPHIVGNKTIMTVMRRAAGAPNGLEISSTNNGTNMFLGNNGTLTEGKGRFSNNRATQVFDLQVPLLADQWVMKRYMRNGTAERLQVNDAVASANVGFDFAAGNYTVSDSFAQPFRGDMAEVLIYNRALSDLESESVLDYLQAKWSEPSDSVYSIAPDITVPATTSGSPAPGVRVRQTTAAYAGSAVYHTLYLPTDWQPGRRYPVIVEYPPNGPYNGFLGDTTTGRVDDISLGYGLTGGAGYILIGMPTIGGSPLENQLQWWGDVNATKDYCLRTVREVCENYGGDSSSVILAGFSRGSIACNFLGLHDDAMADVWLAFIPHAYYDGQVQWGYAGDDAASALTRLQRLKGRAQHVSNEMWITGPEDYLATTGVSLSAFRFRTLPFGNHTDLWALRPVQLRRAVRAWLAQTMVERPGTRTISGRVTDAAGVPLAGVRIQSGFTHFTFTEADGSYALAGIIDSTRTVSASGPGTFDDQTVTVAGANVTNVNFQAAP